MESVATILILPNRGRDMRGAMINIGEAQEGYDYGENGPPNELRELKEHHSTANNVTSLSASV